jgi:hypothetical protein
MKTGVAEVDRTYGPFGEGSVHGVTFDGELVWFARDNELVAFDPTSEKVVKRHTVPADAGTAFDGENLYQLAGGEILVVRPQDGRVLRKMAAPGKGADSGMAYADGTCGSASIVRGRFIRSTSRQGRSSRRSRRTASSRACRASTVCSGMA